MKMKQSNDLASMILEALGGSANIVSLLHCMTRLRLDVKNMDVVKVNQCSASTDENSNCHWTKGSTSV